MNGVLPDTRYSKCSGRLPGAWLRIRTCAWALLMLVAGGLCFLSGPVPRASAEESVLNKEKRLEIRRVVIEGNRTIPADAIAKKIKIRPGQSVTSLQIRNEVAALHKTRWFLDVTPVFRQTDDDGYELVFKVRERPILRGVTYKGNDKIKTKQLQAITNLRVNGAFDISLNREAVRAIERHYHEKGYTHAKITLEKGDSEDDREVIFAIEEGPKVIVKKIKFKGNDFFSSALLRTKLKTSTRKFWVWGGKFDPATIPDDMASLKAYYHSLGFFDVRIKDNVQQSKDRSKVIITYEIEEGIRSKIGKIIINGTRVVKEEDIRKELKLREGDDFLEADLTADIKMIRGKYGKLGRLRAQVSPDSRYYEEPGKMDLVYNINEDKPYRIRKIIVKINGDYPTTKETAILNRMLIKPGDLADPAKILRSKRRLEGSQLFETGRGGRGKGPTINIREAFANQNRGKTPDIIRAQGFDSPAANPLINNSPQGDPLGQSLNGPQADWPDASNLDLEVGVDEAQTGRLMIGAGLNSDTGVQGSIVLDEKNFDIFRPPTSFDDLWNGRAWRGDGQQFRLEAVPGVRVNRYLANWRDPYFMDRNISFGVSGFYYDRIYNDWDERRVGGRLTFGKQFNDEWSGSLAFRGENVTLSNPDLPAPPSLASALGDSLLTTLRGGIIHDTRDAAFLPSEGHYLELAYEQGFGDFNYPRVELEGRQYFQVGSRADGSGRQIFTLRGEMGWTGDETPIFEKFFGGGFQSFRGFRFRGVSPREFNVTVGGQFLALGTLEYMHPLMADDSVQAVVFTDFGSVEENVSLSEFRMTAGVGLRITVPQLGPVPLALDWAFPITDQLQDERQLFQFYFGMFN